jgi:hypothetical protein
MSDHLPLICDIVIQTPAIQQNITLNLKVYLEGAFGTTEMKTDLIPIIPLSQPYNFAPWNYPGTETVTAIPNNVVDWVLIELRDAVNATSANSATRIARQSCFLLKDGSVVGLDGLSLPQFNNSFTQQLFVIIWHRNHLGIMSAAGLTQSGEIYTYDYSSSLSSVYGSGAGYKIIYNGICGMVSGDSNHDGLINLTDKAQWSTYAGENVYLDSDFSMDSEINNHDKNDIWLPNQIFFLQVPQ